MQGLYSGWVVMQWQDVRLRAASDLMLFTVYLPVCLSSLNCISCQVWCRPRKLGIPRGGHIVTDETFTNHCCAGHLRGVLRISLWPCQWWTGIHYRWRRPEGSWQRPGHCSEGGWAHGLRHHDEDDHIDVQICFSAAGLGGVRTSWDAVLWQDRLYVSVTASQLADGSKRAFVSLLEYAEEELGVSDVVACLDRWDDRRPSFLAVLLPPSCQAPPWQQERHPQLPLPWVPATRSRAWVSPF